MSDWLYGPGTAGCARIKVSLVWTEVLQRESVQDANAVSSHK